MDLLRVATIGTYPPTQCGIATFGAALRTAMAPGLDLSASPVISTRDRAATPGEHPRREVGFEWVHGDVSALARINATTRHCDAWIVQHEFGIYEGPDGVGIVDLVAAAPVPVVVVLHTIPERPSPRQRDILETLSREAAAVVTLTHAARRRLVRHYDVDERRVRVILHGAAPNIVPALHSTSRRPATGHRPTLLTWGLIGPGKGLEHAIDAMAHLVDLDPTPRYLIAGETHPKIRLHEGERYRTSLERRARDLGVADLVEFDAQYRDLDRLAALVRSADIVVLPYESREQISSGVLVEALASGKPVVATSFPHAREALATGAGHTVPHDDPRALAAAVRSLLMDTRAMQHASAAAEREGRALFWPVIGQQYLSLLHEIVYGVVAEPIRYELAAGH